MEESYVVFQTCNPNNAKWLGHATTIINIDEKHRLMVLHIDVGENYHVETRNILERHVDKGNQTIAVLRHDRPKLSMIIEPVMRTALDNDIIEVRYKIHAIATA